jgi:MFS family permease
LKIITRNVLILSVVSLLNDTSGEMITPILPLYLKSIGFSFILIGVLEGIAEATAGLSKGYFGNYSDNTGRRLPFVQIGYLISAITKPILLLSVFPLWVFFVRTLDRFGKGVRSSSRDAILSDEATPATKGRVFGFHRAMDTCGAVIGPLIALIYLHYHPENYIMLFAIAFIPSLLAILFTFFIKEKIHDAQIKPRPKFLEFLKYWKESPALYRKLVGALLVFALFNSSDAFLLLKIKESGLDDTTLISIFIFYNLIYALFSYPMGILADKIGMKKIFITGLILFAFTYSGIAFANNKIIFFMLFFLYGIYSAATEGIAKAWISNISDKKNTATAIGTYNAFQSIATLLASTIAGLIWFQFGSTATFLLTSIVTLLVVVYMVAFVIPAKEKLK